MRFEIVALGQLSALGRLELLHGAPVPPSVLGGERLDRVDEAVAVVALDLVLGQLLSHGRYPTPTRRSTSSVRRDLELLYADFPLRATGSLLAFIDFTRSADDAPSSDNP